MVLNITFLCFILDSCKSKPRYTLIHYIFKGREHEITNILPHGNTKRNNPYVRLMPSTRKALEASVSGKVTLKETLDKVYTSVGDVTQARSLGQLPRGPQDIYNARKTYTTPGMHQRKKLRSRPPIQTKCKEFGNCCKKRRKRR